MTKFEDREHGFEAKFAHDNENEFKLKARRDKLLAQWAAEKMRYNQQKTEDYINSVIDADIIMPGDEDVIVKLLKDFANAGVEISRSEIEKAITKFDKEVHNN